MYTIKEAAARTGVSVPTLRAWERRYGVVQPVRTAAGYRLYDADSIARLRAMRGLIEAGWSARQAATRVREAPDSADVLAASGGASEREAKAPTPAPAADHSAAIDLILVAARELDLARLEDLLDSALAEASFERAMDTVVFPGLTAVGAAWERGDLDIANEHAASHVVMRRLARLFDAAGRADRPPVALLGLPPGARHEIGLLAFAVAALRAGVPVLYLGADVPADSWLATLDRTGIRVVVIGVPTGRDVAPAANVLNALMGRRAVPAILAGGSAAPGLAAASGVRILPTSLGAAAATLAEVVAAEPGRRRAP